MLNNRHIFFLHLTLTVGLAALFFSAYKGHGSAGVGPEQIVRSINLDKNFDFCGEKFPMDNWDVRQRLDAELLRNVYFHSQTILVIQRANAIFPVIEPILKSEGAPEDLKYLAVAESALSNVVSPAGAKGVWQFMKGTAIQYGLEVSDEIDERYDLEKCTRAAIKYLQGEKNRLGSWVLAAAAYNGGPGRIAQDKATQRATNFFEMNLAADETMRYPFRIVAIKEVMLHPDEYEYVVEKEHLYPPLAASTTIEVKGAVANWGDFARQHGTNYRMLKLYNPWLMDSKLTNKAGKTYRVRVPV